ncbi:MAG: transglycosylase domain-containing protein [Coriobacteriia bacterium]
MNSPRLERILKVLAAVLAVVCILFLGLGVYLYKLSSTLPDLRVDPDAFKPARTSVVYAADGSLLAAWHGEQDRTVVKIDQIPQSMRDATIAIEDERFFLHQGVDAEAIMRALRENTEAGEYAQGGSTITQQVVKLLFTEGERTLTRKVREALMAYQLETKADKEQVLETYLNLVYFGQGSYGVESAAQRYFGKPAAGLTVAESALLAGLIQSPSRYSPGSHPEAALERRDVVLAKMEELGYLTGDEYRDARAEKMVYTAPAEAGQIAPHFVEYVKQYLIDQLGSEMVFQGGLRVQTTLNPALQAQAEEAARALLPSAKDPEVSLVCLDHTTGEIVAMVGGRDYATDKFNLAVQGKRQPGSAFKPFVLVTALKEGIRPSDVFPATPYSVKVKDGTWNVQNYENAITSGSMTLSAATNWSVNAVYARLIMKVGPEDVVETAKAMGITTPLEPNPAIALGGLRTGVSALEMASAYGTIATGGMRRVPTAVVKVTDDRGMLVFEPERTETRAIPEGVAKQASVMLHDVVEVGTGQAAKIGQWAAGKTGTTQAYRDAWFVGYSGNLCTSVWVGYRQGQVSMTNVHGIKVTGGSYPARVWQRFMAKAVKQRSRPVAPAIEPAQPGDTAGAGVSVTICTQSLLLANERCPDTIEMYLDDALVPTSVCGVH